MHLLPRRARRCRRVTNRALRGRSRSTTANNRRSPRRTGTLRNASLMSDDSHAIRSLEVNRDRNLIEGWEVLTNEAEDEFSRWRCG